MFHMLPFTCTLLLAQHSLLSANRSNEKSKSEPNAIKWKQILKPIKTAGSKDSAEERERTERKVHDKMN